jgi:hypothetical protein
MAMPQWWWRWLSISYYRDVTLWRRLLSSGFLVVFSLQALGQLSIGFNISVIIRHRETAAKKKKKLNYFLFF